MFRDYSTPGQSLAAPTACLPSIKLIQTIPLPELRSLVDYLRFLYNPEVRGSRRRKALSSRPKDQEGDGRLRAIRADPFERSHAIRWLTALIARSGTLFTSASDSEDNGNEENARDSLIEDAASLLAACAGTAASGHLIRTYTLGPSPMGEEVVLRLTDAPLENGDYASVGAQTWGGACVMADMVFEDPEQFALSLNRNSLENAGKAFHVLELGAGTGLVGLAIAKLLELRNVRANVVLTDVHPSVLSNLRSNTTANFAPITTSCVDASVVSLNWSSFASAATSGNNTLGTFDLIVGADIVYETGHAMWIKACLEKLLRTDAQFHLVIPLRRTHATESSTIEQVFGHAPPNNGLVIVHREHFSCDAHSDANSRMWDRVDEVENEEFLQRMAKKVSGIRFKESDPGPLRKPNNRFCLIRSASRLRTSNSERNSSTAIPDGSLSLQPTLRRVSPNSTPFGDEVELSQISLSSLATVDMTGSAGLSE